MKRKILALLLAVLLLGTLAACGQTAASSKSAPQESASQAVPADGSEAAASGAAEGAKVALVCGGAVNDGGWNAAALNGLNMIRDANGAEVAYSEIVPAAEMTQVIRTYARQGYQLIFGHGFEFGEAMKTAAAEFPDTKFVVVNAVVEDAPDNLTCAVFKHGELGYFSGMAAALVSESKKLGIVSPDDNPNNTAEIESFEAGAKAIDPAAEVMVGYTGSWTDIPKAKEAAQAQIDKGCDVILSMGDAYSVGVYQAAEAAGIHTVGWVSDQYEISPNTVICSGITSVDMVYSTIGDRFADGSLVGGVNVFGIQDGAQKMSELYGLDDEQKAKVEQAMQDYLNGKLEIHSLYG